MTVVYAVAGVLCEVDTSAPIARGRELHVEAFLTFDDFQRVCVRGAVPEQRLSDLVSCVLLLQLLEAYLVRAPQETVLDQLDRLDLGIRNSLTKTGFNSEILRRACL